MLLLLKCLATLCCVCLVIRSCLTLFDPMDCSPPGSSVHGDSPGKNTEVGCHALLQGIFPTQGSTQVSRIIGRFFTVWATREVPSNSNCLNLTKEWYLIWSYNSLLSQTFQFLINIYMEIQFSSVQSLSHVRLFATPWTVTCQAPLSMGILQARIPKWVAIPFFRGSSQPRDQTWVSYIAGRFFTGWATREAPRNQRSKQIERYIMFMD